MATNNYYNFTHAGTQYGTQYSAATPGTAYPTPQGYGQGSGGQGFGTTQTADQFVLAGYARPTTGHNYYNQGATAGPGGGGAYSQMGKMQPRAAATSTVYPSYSANTPATGSYAGFIPPQQQNQQNQGKSVYNAVSAYAQGGGGVGRGGGAGGSYNNNRKVGIKSRSMAKPVTLHYCDVCKISCAGPQTYKEHLEGQKHKKKEAALKTGTPTVIPKGGPAGLRCELCDVTCTGSDAYAAHIRGSKHQKVVKLHTKLGKPIPSNNPTVIAGSSSGNGNAGLHSNLSASSVSTSVPPSGGVFARPVAPKINYVGIVKTEPTVSVPHPVPTLSLGSKSTEQSQTMTSTYTSPTAIASTTVVSPAEKSPIEYVEKDIQPVGQDYIEEIRNEEGKVVSFNCKLCECRFNDPNAKEMHMKGRRHRLQYKKKVNPDLVVDVKPSSRQKKLEDRRSSNRSLPMRKLPISIDAYGRGPVPLLPPGQPRFSGFGGPGPVSSPYYPPIVHRPDTHEDEQVMAKHAEIYPEEEELNAIQKIVSNTEKALKFVSDRFAEEDCIVGMKLDNESVFMQNSEADLQAARKLKGVMRVGNLAKGLLLRGNREVELVVLCSEKPTTFMLDRVFECLPKQMELVAQEENYSIQKIVENAGIKVASSDDPKIEVMVTLTSPLLRSGGEAQDETQSTQVTDPTDLLDKRKCLDALAALRRAKWFQARATTLQSCVIVIRIFRDLCQRVSEFKLFPSWAMELLTEKAINSAGVPISPGEAIRIVLEIISSGFLLNFGPGLLDPCEKESCDALAGIDYQIREDITSWSQQALRKIAFRQIHDVLGMDPYHPNKSGNRKRRRDPSGNVEDDSYSVTDGKKDKKDNVIAVEHQV